MPKEKIIDETSSVMLDKIKIFPFSYRKKIFTTKNKSTCVHTKHEDK
jgi:hypothetical protein